MLQPKLLDSQSPAPSAAPSLRAERLTRREQLYPLVPRWELLAARAAAPNVFYEPWMMLPALEHFGARLRLEVIAVYAGTGAGRRLVGLFPFERQWSLESGRPILRLRSLRYYYCSLCTPLIDRDLGYPVVQAALAAVRGALELDLVGADGPVLGWLQDAAREQGDMEPGPAIDRAFLHRAASAEEYVATSFKREAKKKDMARLERRLAELGELRLESLEIGEPLEPWLDEFLDLEASGWKGAQGSALASVAGGADFFRRICREAYGRHRLEMHALRLDARPVAQMCLLRVADGAIFFRTAYDEAYARYSPGLLLAFRVTCDLHRRPGIHWLDSCSDPRAIMANRVWKDRRQLAGLRLRPANAPLWARLLSG